MYKPHTQHSGVSWRALLMWLSAAALVLQGCTSAATTQPVATQAPPATEASAKPTEPPADSATSAPTQAAAEPKRLVIVIAEEPPNLDPGEGTVFALNTYRNTYETLVGHDAATGALVPELALSWEQTNDTTWRFHLRQGVKFHDGEPFNAEAAAWVLNYLYNPDNNKHILGLGSLPAGTHATAVDEYTLDVTTPDPYPILPAGMFFANMASPKAIQADTEGAFRTMVGTGPYKFKEWVAGEKLILEKNSDYWGGDVSEIEEIEYVWRNESALRSAMAEAGEADIAVALTPQDAKTGNVVAVPISETHFIRMDLPNPPLSDIRVRRAICLLIDRQNIADKLYGGYAVPATQLIASNVVGYNPDIPLIPYDPEQAKALIAEAAADGVPMDRKITVYLRSTVDQIVLQMMLAILATTNEAGLNLNLEVYEPAKYQAIARQQPVPADRLAIFWGRHGNEMQDASFTITTYYMPGGVHMTLSDATGQAFVDLYKEASRLSGPERQTALAEVMKFQADNVVASCPIVHMQYIYKLADGVQFQPRPDHLILAKDVKLP